MLNTIEIEEKLETLVGDLADGNCMLHDFPFRLMEAYSASRNEIAKLRMKHPAGLMASDMLWPKKLLYRPADLGQVQATIYDGLKDPQRLSPQGENIWSSWKWDQHNDEEIYSSTYWSEFS
jgi:hypothetical protein